MNILKYNTAIKKLNLSLNFINLFDHLTKNSYYKFITTTISFKIIYLITTLKSLITETKKNLKEKNTIKKYFLLLTTIILLIHHIHNFKFIERLLYLEEITLTPLKFLIYQNSYSNGNIKNILIAIFMILFITNITLNLISIFTLYTPSINTIEILFISIQTFMQLFQLYYTNNPKKSQFHSHKEIELTPIDTVKSNKDSIISYEEKNTNNQLVIGKVTPT